MWIKFIAYNSDLQISRNKISLLPAKHEKAKDYLFTKGKKKEKLHTLLADFQL